MASGLEAVGAASAILQLISFSTSVVSQAIDIYKDRTLPHSSLEDHAEELQNVTSRVESYCQDARMKKTPDQKEVAVIAEKCQKSAQKLQDEVRSLSRTCQKSKALNALASSVKTRYRLNKLQELERNLQKQKEILEAHLIVNICTQTQAMAWTQNTEFKTLSDHVQHLIGQIAADNTKLESRVQNEHGETRAVLKKEIQDGGGKVASYVTSEIATASQRTRFIDSLKFYSMNQRYNDITDPADATYKRIFAAYDKIYDAEECDETTETELLPKNRFLDHIDKGLDELAAWLQSSNPLFWINGKPGSGKSTFMKTIINSESVKALLERWNPKVEITSHFFWKIGSEPQSSVKGLLCTLCHQILLSHHDLLSSVPNIEDLILAKSSYHDWSLAEAKNLLLNLLNSDDKYFCIFIDGLDEVNEEDGFDTILSVVAQLAKHQRVKLCVSSRAEPQLEMRLEALHAQSIKMEWFTAYDMQLYAEEKLEPLKSSPYIHPIDYKDIISRLVKKADGVFLWICLATRSIKDGIENGDSYSELYSRLEQLPRQLEDLYTEMWNRLNHNVPIYKEAAASIFRCVIATRKMYPPLFDGAITFYLEFPTALSIGYAVDLEFRKEFTQATEDPEAYNPTILRDRIEKMIKVRSAGLLEVCRRDMPKDQQHHKGWKMEGALWITSFMRHVQFIHRTAYDFLVGTEVGKSILGYGTSTPLKLQFSMMESLICLAELASTRNVCSVDVHNFMEMLVRYVKDYDPDSSMKSQYTEQLSLIMGSLEKAYSSGYADYIRLHAHKNAKPYFLGMTAQFEDFDNFTVSHAKKIASSADVEDVWRTVWNRNSPATEDTFMSSIKLIEATLPFASDWHRENDFTPNIHEPDAPIFWRHTPFTRLLVQGLYLVSWIRVANKYGKHSISKEGIFAYLKLLLAVAPTVPNWDRPMIVISQFFPTRGIFLTTPRVSSLRIYSTSCQVSRTMPDYNRLDLGWVFYHQLSLKFMFQQVFQNMKTQVDIPLAIPPELDELLQTWQVESPYAKLIIRLGKRSGQIPTCYRAITQAPFQALNSILFTSRSYIDPQQPAQLQDEISSLTASRKATEVTRLGTAIDELAQLGNGLHIISFGEGDDTYEEQLGTFERNLNDEMRCPI